MPLEQDVLDIGKQLEKLVSEGKSVCLIYIYIYNLFFLRYIYITQEILFVYCIQCRSIKSLFLRN